MMLASAKMRPASLSLKDQKIRRGSGYEHERRRNNHREGETTGRGSRATVVDLVEATGTRRGWAAATGWSDGNARFRPPLSACRSRHGCLDGRTSGRRTRVMACVLA